MVEWTPKTPQEQENDVFIVACSMIDEFPKSIFFTKLPMFIHRGGVVHVIEAFYVDRND